MTQLLRIAVPSPLRKLFDYFPLSTGGNSQAELPATGTRVRVPFGRRTVVGIVIEQVALEAATGAGLDPEKLRPVEAYLDTEPLLPDSLFELTCWAAGYYQSSLGDSFHSVLPALLRKGEALQAPSLNYWQLTSEGKGLPDGALQRAPQQAKALALLQQQACVAVADVDAFDVKPAAFKELAKKGLAEQICKPIAPAGIDADNLLKQPHLALNAQQQTAFECISAALGTFAPFLLEGVTGSGKTEVYLQCIERVLAAGKQALVLVPEIGLTPQTIERFAKRFNVEIAVLHSGLTDRERLNSWLAAKFGHAKIIIGTRSAAFTPMCDPGIIIIDEEHDASFKQQDGFRYSARDVSVMRANLEHIPIVLGSATPATETLHNANFGRYQHLKLTERAGRASQPQTHIIDIRRQLLDEGLSAELLEAIDTQLSKGHQALIFLNRRGFAPTLLCHDCGWLANCPHCDAKLTVHQDPAHLHCHHCDYQHPLVSRCPDCKSSHLEYLGHGTERSEQALQRIFPNQRIIRIDRDTTSRKYAMQEMVDIVNAGGPAILLGTQMLAKGHHFPYVTLVAILDIDSGFFSADFRGPERMGQLLVQVSGRAGRAAQPGHVYIQTHYPDHPMLATLIHRGYHAFAQSLLAERQQLQLPPFSFMAVLRAEDQNPSQAKLLLQQALAHGLSQVEKLQFIGPISAPLARRAGRFRYFLLIQSPQRSRLQRNLVELCAFLDTLPLARKIRWSIDVDPQDLY